MFRHRHSKWLFSIALIPPIVRAGAGAALVRKPGISSTSCRKLHFFAVSVLRKSVVSFRKRRKCQVSLRRVVKKGGFRAALSIASDRCPQIRMEWKGAGCGYSYEYPALYVVGVIHGAVAARLGTSNRTQSEANVLWEATRKKPFNSKILADILLDYSNCLLLNSSATHSNVTNLAIGRSGSGTLKNAFLINGKPGHHWTTCTALDAQKAGYKAVVVTIRDPVARILSGFQRRSEGFTPKVENVAFQRNFTEGDKSVNFYLDALREKSNPMHMTALELTYGVHRQSYMYPLADYYGLTNPALKIRVYYLCTPTLSDDFEKLAQFLDWPKPSAAREYYMLSTIKEKESSKNRDIHKKESQSSHEHLRHLGSVSGVRSEVAAEAVSDINKRWIHESAFKADSELNIRYCGPNRKDVNYHDGNAII